MKVNHRITSQAKRILRVRSKVKGTTERPRLTVYRSNKSMYIQVIDDQTGTTIAAVKTATGETPKTGTKLEQAQGAAKLLAQKLKKANISKLVFDRGGYRYHGRVKAVADAMRDEKIEV